jgi:hypothetical protein
MTWFLYIVAFLFIAGGAGLVLNTESARDFLQGIIDDASYRLWGIIALIFGALLMVSSFWSSVTWFIFLLGIAAAGKGVFLLLAEETVVTGLTETWKVITDRGLRLWGLIYVIFGVAILAWT